MPTPFVHLHVHTEYSLLDGAGKVPDMVRRAQELGFPALAITDHGYMYGCATFFKACQDAWQETRRAAEAIGAPQPPSLVAPTAQILAYNASLAEYNEQARASYEAKLASLGPNDPKPSAPKKVMGVLKPIIGCEVYFTPDNELKRDRRPELYHMILIAKDTQGYKNLMHIVSDAAVRGFYYKPRVTMEMLEKYKGGLIGTSACIAGVIPQCIDRHDMAGARDWARKLAAIFDPGDFYIELQDQGVETDSGMSEHTLNTHLDALAKEMGFKTVGTNDIHYINQADAVTQDLMLCIGTVAKVSDEKRFRFKNDQFYMKSGDEMAEALRDFPDCIPTTLEIADKCTLELEFGKIVLPRFPLPEGETNESYLRKKAIEGLKERYGDPLPQEVEERMNYELDIICTKGFAAYFLIVQEFTLWAKANGIGVGPGRGSAAGSIISYALNITTFDPLANDLMFERFLSPQRTEMPDIDMDFDDERRLEVVQHVRDVYGPEKIAHVVTFQKMQAKAAVKDAARVLDYPMYISDRITKMISGKPGTTLDGSLGFDKSKKHADEYSPDLREDYDQNPDTKRIIDAARSLEGITRGEGVHASAVIICRDDVSDYVPVKYDTKGGVIITQYDGLTTADMGLLKMDFLGLRTLTLISKALQYIKENHGETIDPDKIPNDDPAIFELFEQGRTAGVFQVESPGMTALLKRMHPDRYSDIVAVIALYRPGPLNSGMVDDFVDRKLGKKRVVYYDDRLADILEPTYGTIVYQEQVMRISMKMSGFSAGESDKVRKAVAKKHIEDMQVKIQKWADGKEETMEQHWHNGAVANGYSYETAHKIWTDVLAFAQYAFNKSHSAAYAILVMQTAWLKAHYPMEYMAAVLTSFTGKNEKIVHYVAAARGEGIAVLPPDVNSSRRDFTATENGIRFGLAGIKGVGENIVQSIIDERDAQGPYESLQDLLSRIDLTQCNRKTIEALIKSGAFDSTGYTRRHLMRMLDEDEVLENAVKRQKEQSAGQESLFDMFDCEEVGLQSDVPEPDGVEWERRLKLNYEREVLGIYVSDHPLAPFTEQLAEASDKPISALLAEDANVDGAGGKADAQADDGAGDANGADGNSSAGKGRSGRRRRMQHFAGMVTGFTQRYTKAGEAMATFTLEDMSGSIGCVVFPKAYANCKNQIADDAILRVLARVDEDDRGKKLLISEVESLRLNENDLKPHTIELKCSAGVLTQHSMDLLSEALSRHGGEDPVVLFVKQSNGRKFRAELPIMVNARSNALYSELCNLLGQESVNVVIG